MSIFINPTSPCRVKVVKLNAWESYFQRTVSRIRVQELSKQKSSAVLYGVILSMWLAAPIMMSVYEVRESHHTELEKAKFHN